MIGTEILNRNLGTNETIKVGVRTLSGNVLQYPVPSNGLFPPAVVNSEIIKYRLLKENTTWIVPLARFRHDLISTLS